jgi:hypothetical protein
MILVSCLFQYLLIPKISEHIMFYKTDSINTLKKYISHEAGLYTQFYENY